MAMLTTARFRRAAALTPIQWGCLAIALKELALARLRHALQPAGTILRDLEQGRGSGEVRAAAGDAARLARVAWAINAAATLVPWRSDCLLRVMAADRWLRRLGHSPEFFLGAKMGPAGKLEAHAWLHCGELVVTGGDGAEFTPLMRTRCG